MSIVTLTTDLGYRDAYVGVLKGALLKLRPDLTVIDIAHDLRKHDLEQVAYIMKQAMPHFAAGTVHIGICDINLEQNNRILIALHGEQWIVCTDNGLLALISDDWDEIYEMQALVTKYPSFPAIDWLLPAAVRLSNNEHPRQWATQTLEYRHWLTTQASLSVDSIRANVLYVDGYDNIVLNVTRAEFDRVRKGRRFRIELFRETLSDEIAGGYEDAGQGDILVLFNTAGYMEIAINKGKASSLLNLKLRDSVLIEFYS